MRIVRDDSQKKMQELTDNEKYIIETLRSLKPFENIQIIADKTGKVNNFLILRSTKVLLGDGQPIYTT